MGARWRQAMKAAGKDTETLFFEPRQDPGEKTRISVRVSYNQEEDVQRYFRWTFLTPQDRVERWSKQVDHKGKHKYMSEVSVILGQSRMPPRKHSQICWDEHAEVIQKQLSFWQEWIFNLQVSQEYTHNGGEKTAAFGPFFADLELERDATAQEFMDMVQYRANVPAHDRFGMTCDIIKAREYCHVCCTVAHSFAACKARGCTVCGSKDHPYYKCIRLCKCKTRPPHKQSECPLKSARAGPNHEVVSLRRIQNQQNSLSSRGNSLKNEISEIAQVINNAFEWPVAVPNLSKEDLGALSDVSEKGSSEIMINEDNGFESPSMISNSPDC